jgi:hypothetical protein
MSRAASGRAPAALVVSALALAAAACHRGPARCPAGAPSSLEIRDGNGALELAVKGSALCDGQLRKLGDLASDPDGTVSLRDAGGKPLYTVRRDDHVAHLSTPAGEQLRLFRSDKELRVLQPDGVPLGTIIPEPRLATLYNPAQSPIGRVQPRDPDAVVTDLAGTTLTYVVPSHNLHAAAAFGIPRLDRPQQLLIYLYWSR